jgi:hypothetical protein
VTFSSVCSNCGRVRCGTQWVQVEAGNALEKNSMCPDCKALLYPFLKRRRSA